MQLYRLNYRTGVLGLFFVGIGLSLSGYAVADDTKDKWHCQPDSSGSQWVCAQSSEIPGSDLPNPNIGATNTETTNAEAANTETVSTETANVEVANTEIVSTETANVQAASTETVGAETANAEVANTEIVSTETANAQAINTETVNTKTANTKTKSIVLDKPVVLEESTSQIANIEKSVTTEPGLWALCESGEYPTLLGDLADFTPGPPGKTKISADQSDGDPSYFVLTGNVDIIREDQRLMADKVIYDKKNNRVDAFDNVNFILPGMQISGSRGYKQIKGDRLSFKNAQFEMLERNARGTASQIQRESMDITRMTKLSYSTCPNERQDWVLTASKLKLDRKKGEGKARNAMIRFKNIPIFYTPFFSFPIDDRRKSGFLPPSFVTSDESGTAIEIPYYWNISPNRDATIKPKNLTKRGVLLGGEYRYLHSRSSGKFDFEYLPNDKIFKADRRKYSYKHKSRFGENWSTDVLLNNVSDDDYFINLGNNLGQSSTTHLERRIDVAYTRPTWSVLTRFQNFQPVGASESYRRVPQIKLKSDFPEKSNGLQYHLNAEFVRFDHKNAVTTGSRLDVMPGISWNYSDIAYFITPKISLRHTRYSLDLPVAGSPDDPSRTTPIFSLDSGIFFERESSFGGWGYLQTLEPRMYYLYVPYRDQSSLPVFDTGALSDSLSQLFRENRFSGPDRQGDANQITTAITTRFIERTSGQERLSATIGQLYFLADRKVNLSGNAVTSFNRSDIFAEIRIQPWKYTTLSANIQRDTRLNQASKTSTQILYLKDPRHILNASYRYQDNSLNQATLSSIWPISQRWSSVAHWEYSFKEEGNTLEGIGGIQYDNCCWSVRLVYRNYFLGKRDNNAIFLQLSLKGLTKIGKGIESLLEKKIPGYRSIDSVE